MKKIVFVFTFIFVFLVGCSKSINTENKIYSDVYKSVSEALTEKNSLKSFDEFDDEYVELDNYDEVKAVNALVYYIHLLYLNESFPATTAPIKFVGNYVKDGVLIQYNEVTLQTKLDKDNNMLYCNAYGDSHMQNSDSSFFYLNLDINYDFEKNELIAFNTYMLGVVDEELDDSFIIFNKYVDNKLFKVVNYNSRKAEIVSAVSENLWKPYKEILSTAVVAKDNYDNEYVEATDHIFGEDYFN